MQTATEHTEQVSGYAWVVLGVCMLAGVSAPLNQFKVPPVMPELMREFNLSLSQAGLLMSIFAITGLVLALPAGLILQRLGARISGLAALGSLALGSGLGALSRGYTGLLASRLLEGVGMGLVAVVAPAVIVGWFPPRRRGLPMGIWATWVSLGSLFIYNAAPALNALSGWRLVWLAGALFAGLAFALYGLLVRPAPSAEGDTSGKRPPLLKALARKDIWLLAVSFAAFNLVVIGVVASYYPTFLKTVRGVSLAEASLITSLKMITVILAAPLAGWLSDRIGSPRRVILFSLAGLAVFMLFPFNVQGIWVPVLMVALGILAGSLPTATFALAPEAMGGLHLGGPHLSGPHLSGPHLSGLGMGVIMIGQNLGQLAGPILFGALVEAGGSTQAGWASAGYWMIAALAVGWLAMRAARTR